VRRSDVSFGGNSHANKTCQPRTQCSDDKGDSNQSGRLIRRLTSQKSQQSSDHRHKDSKYGILGLEESHRTLGNAASNSPHPLVTFILLAYPNITEVHKNQGGNANERNQIGDALAHES
jgi:hypothetical protein